MTPAEDDRPLADIDRGTPGASARARYERLSRRDDERRRQRFGRLAPLVAFLAGPKRSTEAWAIGADGEERIGMFLDEALGGDSVVLHDRRVPHGRANLDHLAVVPSGVWVIDSKHYHGRLERRRVGGWCASREVLYIGNREQSRLVTSAGRQRAEVARHVAPHVCVRAALCFTGIELGLFMRPFVLDDVLVTWPNALAKTLLAPGPLGAEARRALAEGLAETFGPYAR